MLWRCVFDIPSCCKCFSGKFLDGVEVGFVSLGWNVAVLPSIPFLKPGFLVNPCRLGSRCRDEIVPNLKESFRHLEHGITMFFYRWNIGGYTWYTTDYTWLYMVQCRFIIDFPAFALSINQFSKNACSDWLWSRKFGFIHEVQNKEVERSGTFRDFSITFF